VFFFVFVLCFAPNVSCFSELSILNVLLRQDQNNHQQNTKLETEINNIQIDIKKAEKGVI
jgi:hypothetical protein